LDHQNHHWPRWNLGTITNWAISNTRAADINKTLSRSTTHFFSSHSLSLSLSATEPSIEEIESNTFFSFSYIFSTTIALNHQFSNNHN
jgi:hypothetical protein